MKKIVIGEFASQKSIEKCLMKDPDEFGVFSDFETLPHLDLKRLGAEELWIHINSLDTFNKHYEWISSHRDQIILWLAGKEVRRQRAFLENEGYRTSLSLRPLTKRADTSGRQEGVCSPRTVLLSGRFDVALQTAYELASATSIRCGFTDLDSVNAFSLLRIRQKQESEWRFVNELLASGGQEEATKVGSLYVVPAVLKTEISTDQALTWIERGRRLFDVHFVYCHSSQMVLAAALASEAHVAVYIADMAYEDLVFGDSWLQVCDMHGGLVGIESSDRSPRFSEAQTWVTSKFLGIIRKKELRPDWCMSRWLFPESARKSEKRCLRRILFALDLLRRR